MLASGHLSLFSFNSVYQTIGWLLDSIVLHEFVGLDRISLDWIGLSFSKYLVIWYAFFIGLGRIVQMLFENGANVNITNVIGDSALTLAAKKGKNWMLVRNFALGNTILWNLKSGGWCKALDA